MPVMSWSLWWRAVLARWRVVVGVSMAVSAGVLVFVGSMPDVYSARAVVAFTPRLGAGVGAAELRAVLPAYVTYISAPSTQRGLVEKAGVGTGTLAGAVSAGLVSDSSTVSLAVTLPDGASAARVANVLADEVVRFAADDALLTSRVVARALPSMSPSGPPRGLFGSAGVLVALLCGMAAAVLLELARPRVRTSSEVGEATGYRVLARVPRRAGGWEDPAVVAALRAARVAVVSSSPPPATVVVTSSLPGEGKTTVAAGLAVALARAGSSVLLIDADLRRPGLSARFGLRPGTGAGQRPGLGSMLRGDAPLDAGLRPGPVAGLSVLPTAVEPEGAALLAGGFSSLLEGARGRFDIVIVDAPPLLVGGDDTEPIASACDAALLVVARDTPAYLAADAAATLRTLNPNVLGAVANGARQPRFSQHHAPPAPAVPSITD